MTNTFDTCKYQAGYTPHSIFFHFIHTSTRQALLRTDDKAQRWGNGFPKATQQEPGLGISSVWRSLETQMSSLHPDSPLSQPPRQGLGCGDTVCHMHKMGDGLLSHFRDEETEAKQG